MELDSFNRIVIKLGTKIVTGAHGNVERDRLTNLVRNISEFKKSNKEIILVSSGAVGLGRKILDQHEKNNLAFRQACASIGQNLLITVYQKIFATYGMNVAQVLVTADDLADRKKYLNLRAMLQELLAMGVIPIINENDSISTMELEEFGREKVFGDNDKLSALVASKLGADLLILLTDVNALYDSNPQINHSAKRIPQIHELDDLKVISAEGKSELGRGGVDSKIKAVKLASMSGVPSVIASGFQDDIVEKLLNSKAGDIGTFVHARKKISERQKWIGFSSGVEGVIHINEGAQKALEENSASLLPIGILKVEGEFASGAVLSIAFEGREVARGIVNFSSEDLSKLVGVKGPEVSSVLQKKSPEEIVHRDRLIVFDEKAS